jgi:glycosyltransferase involved in cell wall biosynthesis
VQDVEPLLESARMVVVPVRFGAGIKGKVTQALAAGLPVVTTTVGAEGLAATDGSSMLIADTAEGLAERIVMVARDDALWQTLSDAGRELMDANYSLRVLDERMGELLSGEDVPARSPR